MKNKIIFILFLFTPFFAYSNSSCTGGSQCSTHNLKDDFRIYHDDNFLFDRNDQQVAGVTRDATEVMFNGTCERRYCPIRYRLAGDSEGQYRQGYVHQNGFLDRGASAQATEVAVAPAQTVSQPTNTQDQMRNVKNDFRIYNSQNFSFTRNDGQVAGVTGNAEEMTFTGACERNYCPVKYRMNGDVEGYYRQGYVHQNGFLDRGASAGNNTTTVADQPVVNQPVVTQPEVVDNQPAREVVREEPKEEERQPEPAVDPCVAALRQNVCANNKREVENSQALSCKLKQMGGNASSIFTTWVDQNRQTGLVGMMGTISITVQNDGQYKVKGTKNGDENIITQGAGQICLRDGNLRLSAGDINIALTNLNRIQHTMQTSFGNVELDLKATR